MRTATADERLPRRVGRVAEAVGRGLAAGVVGTVAMTVSSTVEMKFRGRAPSTAPARAVGRLLGVRPASRRGEQRFATVAHSVTGVSLGAARGLLDAAVVQGRAGALAATFGIVMAPEVVVAPALSASNPPWRWGAAERAISAFRHVVWAAATDAAYRSLTP